MKLFLSVVSLSTLAYASSAMAEEVHGDIWLYVNSNQLVTGSYDHTTGDIISPNTRVFEAEFGILILCFRLAAMNLALAPKTRSLASHSP